jgi:gamma-glutamylcyclotransferase (GGCT)/AIG2-like uncharacterized protein YtfP
MAAGASAFFVYGTLKRGQANYPLIAPYARAVEPATTSGLLFDHGPFPALIAGAGRVRGELVRLDPADLDAALAQVDRLEDYRPDDPAGSIYLRQVVAVETADGARVPAFIYFYNRDTRDLRPVPSGEWVGPSAAQLAGDGGELGAFKAHVRGFLAQSAHRAEQTKNG